VALDAGAPDAGLPDAGAADAGAGADAGVAETWGWVDVAGSVCGNGAATGLGVNATSRSKDLLIYLQGGGACWSNITCGLGAAANLSDGYGATKFAAEQTTQAVIFNRGATNNPFKDFSYAFVPYCTGDVHAGDATQAYTVFVTVFVRTVFHKSAKNVKADLVELKARFPDAQRVFVAGSSAGAFGAQLNYERVVATWPNAEVHLLADSGQMVNPTGTLLTDWRTAWNMAIPAACVGCETDFTKYPKYLFAKYPTRRFGLLGFTQDNTLRQFFNYDAAGYEAATIALLTGAYDPTSNAKYFVLAGASHTMLGNFSTLSSATGVALTTWTTQFVHGDAAWASTRP
jgi:hypothetical protein